MTLIERYIFKKAGVSTLIVLFSLAGVVWVVQALKEVDIINNKGQTILAYLSLTSLAVPNLILAVIPVALLLSTIHTISSMNTNTELVVVTASGSSNWTIAKPMLILALLCSLFAGLVGHYLSPISLVKLKQQLTDIRADLVTVIIREGSFNSIEGGLTFHIAERGAGGILRGILIADDREEDTSIVYLANEGIVTRTPAGSFLKLKDGEIHQTKRDDESVTVIKYQSYIFDLSGFSGSRDIESLKAKERVTWELFNPDPNDPFYKLYPGRYRSQIHERFSEMLWPFAYVFIILAFSGQARSNRQTFSTSITMASVCVIAARGMGFSAVNSLKSDPNAVFLVYALPVGCIVFGAWFVVTNRPASLPKPVVAQIDRVTGIVAGKTEKLVKQYKLYRRRRAGVEV